MAKNKKGVHAARRIRPTASFAQSGRSTNTARAINSFVAAENGARAFTLQDEARHTAHNHTSWDRFAKLRDRPVSFVSGGLVESLEDRGEHGDHEELKILGETVLPEDDDNRRDWLANDPDQSQRPNPSSMRTASDENASITTRQGRMTLDELGTSMSNPVDADVVIAKDLGGNRLVELVTPLQPAPEEESEQESSSSEEIILFKGRDHLRQHNKASRLSLRDMHDEITAVETTLADAHEGLSPVDDENDDEDAILADYIANMHDEDLQNLLQQPGLNNRDLGGAHDDVKVGKSSGEDNDIQNIHMQQSGVTDSSAQSEHGYSNDERDEEEQDSEEELVEQSMSDEQLALLLAKQEELGLGGDELLLFNDTGVSKPSRSTRQKGQLREYSFTKQLKRLGGLYPSAGDVADAFESLDATNWKHPTLRSGAGGKRMPPAFNVSDSELEASLNLAWEKDRLRKKEKKQAREELRARGLLGKHANEEDPRVKYPMGMNIEQIQDEFRAFLLGSDTHLTFPPMDANARKTIHELANRFKIKSKSSGSGDQRRPVLYRTRNTAEFSEAFFEATIARVGRRYFPRLDTRPRGTRKQASAGGHGNNAAVTVQDGEVVGGSAPEIGDANKGRKMLVRMGWSSGMALGATDNKGITQPIEHIVKRSKAGLG